jgi:HPt (histidine-containing phosphotransfer) domain-containing protein
MPQDLGRYWPELEGIDSKVARNHLCDDAALFRTLLQRFIGDFSAIAPPPPSSRPARLAAQARLLHKLSGGACVLGAVAIQRLATAAEAACEAGDAGRAGRWSRELVTHLDALRLNAMRAFEGGRSDELPAHRVGLLSTKVGLRGGRSASFSYTPNKEHASVFRQRCR